MTSAAWSAVAVYVIDKLAQINTVKNGETTTMVISLRIVIVTRSFSPKVRAEKKMDPYLELWSSGEEEEEVAPVGTCSNYLLRFIDDRLQMHRSILFTQCFGYCYIYFLFLRCNCCCCYCLFFLYSTTKNNIFSLSIPHFTVQCNFLSLAQA